MRAQKREILLLIDNCPAHPKDLDFSTNIRTEFLSANTTSHTQPLDMGIIKVVKHYYRRKLVRRLLSLLSCETPLTPKACKVNLFQVMHYTVGSWESISRDTIEKCFKKAWIPDDSAEEVDDDPDTPDDNVNSAAVINPETAIDCRPTFFHEVTERSEEIQSFFDCNVTFKDFVHADDYTPVCEVQTIEEIVDALRKDVEEAENVQSSGSDGGEEAERKSPVPCLGPRR